MDISFCNSDIVNIVHNFAASVPVNATHLNISFLLLHRSQGLLGCTSCNDGFQAIEKAFTAKKICMKNPNLFVYSSSSDIFIKNCLKYQNRD